eukprot:TRINITY_DN5259_c0_g6_i1.p1 TRINITY_DN5259_c0_g6~~TRINITY_DN5259_c0_g6_i1.p1  ORF type:complete len:550 (-),score=119.86 TRINITY_DN5259_c0_g6_i1:40-1689(-)
MDIAGTASGWSGIKLRQRLGSSCSQADNLLKEYYVPLAICIKMRTASCEFADKVLLSLIDLLHTEANLYRTEMQNLAYSYSEFLSNLTLLTHLTCPPPLTQYSILIGTNEITCTQGPFSELPYKESYCVAQLFSLLDPKAITTLWYCLMAEYDIVLYVKDPNEYFYILEGLQQLLFPLQLNLVKGILSDLGYLEQPFTYALGVIGSMFGSESVLEAMGGDGESERVFVDVGCSEMTCLPNESIEMPSLRSLEQELREIARHFQIELNGVIDNVETRHVAFSKQVRKVMLREMEHYVKDMGQIVKKKKLTCRSIEEAYCSYFDNRCLTAEQSELVKTLGESSAIKLLAQCIEEDKYTDYFRFKAMGEKRSDVLGEQMVVYINSPSSVVLSHAARLAEAATREKSPTRAKLRGCQDEILSKHRVDWINEIFKMETQFKKSASSFYGNSSSFEHTQTSGPGNISTVHKEQGDIELIATEITAVHPSILTTRVKQLNWNKAKKEIFFYGAKGILSFFQDLFCIGDGSKTTLRLLDDIKPVSYTHLTLPTICSV